MIHSPQMELPCPVNWCICRLFLLRSERKELQEREQALRWVKGVEDAALMREQQLQKAEEATAKQELMEVQKRCARGMCPA